MTLARTILALALLLAVAPPSSATESGSTDGDRKSLEALLERLRTERDAYLGRLRGRVEQLLSELESHSRERRASAEAAARKALLELGPEAAPLMLAAIDPGVGASAAASARARSVAGVLRQLESPAITDGLLDIAQSGSAEGRRNAVLVLARTSSPEKVNPVLLRIYSETEGDLREVVLASLAEIGGPANQAVLVSALEDEDPEIVRTALRALTAARNTAVGPQVLAIAREKLKALEHIGELLGYCRACPTAVTEAHLSALLALAQDSAVSARTRVSVIDLVPTLPDAITSGIKRRLKDLSQSGNRQVAEAALVARTLSGDGRAKIDLKKSYDEAVSRNKDWAKPYEERAAMLYRIEEYSAALRDCRKALERSDEGTRPNGDLYILAARCSMHANKLRDAYNFLQDAPISVIQLRNLGQEEIFAKLRNHTRYREVFRLD